MSNLQDELDDFIEALENHLEALQVAQGDADAQAVLASEERIRDAFFTYDDSLVIKYGVGLPLDLLNDDDDEDEGDDEEDDEDAEILSPLHGHGNYTRPFTLEDEDDLENFDLHSRD